jgi:hypothetical protein
VAAFIGWQTRTGDKVTFSSYLSRLGISDEPYQRSDEPSQRTRSHSGKSHSGKPNKLEMEAENAKLSHMGIKVKNAAKGAKAE